MSDSQEGLTFYTQLAPWWPLISPPGEYEEEAAFSATMLRTARHPVRDVLELGSGGGHNAVHLKAHFRLTLVDLSAQMLELSRQLNPECQHQQGDMRSIRLDRTFDAVFVHDAVDYMTSEQDLRLAMETAFMHCRPGGVAVFLPDQTRETFEPGSSCGGTDGPDGRGVRYLEWNWDPDPSDTRVQTEYAFVLRKADGSVRAVHETHHLGLFRREEWLAWLDEVGFEPQLVTEVTTEERTPRDVFLGHRPQP
ncbi:hypothetical protein GCM10008955_40250 [Deinococcus malanensis]|uniref:Methyltransferase domain-containing protein n=1 Tax=Deinococcus malanensis TaxID=1706855 RepID=A0ABQ2F4U2_9DEIO|nr:class I SAM-dependent methyltransferase [Deinococcus malanensis]GGK42448.1 hypothetical protein GCM10008955_40250 [Deinococcus malanensis]